MEFVYVVKRYDLFDVAFPHGFKRPWEVPLEEWIERIRSRGFFVERRHAEKDSSLKQIIPYAVLRRGGDIFVMRRKEKGGESRLFNLRSIGVGGHINPVDGERDPLTTGLAREVGEEVIITGKWEPEPLGVINDESQDVGAVHFGMVYGVEVAGEVMVRETDQLEGRFESALDLSRAARESRESFESWSALILDRVSELG